MAGKVGRPMGKLHQEDIRTKIQVAQLVKVLTDHALNENASEIIPSRMKAIQILLSKSLPDLSAVQISGDEQNPLVLNHHHNVFGELLKAMQLAKQAE